MRLKYSTANAIMMPVGATFDSPSSTIPPSSPANPPASAASTGSSTSATSTETRLVMVSNRNRAIVAKPRAAGMVALAFSVAVPGAESGVWRGVRG
jgi:hypothetical protein